MSTTKMTTEETFRFLEESFESVKDVKLSEEYWKKLPEKIKEGNRRLEEIERAGEPNLENLSKQFTI